MITAYIGLGSNLMHPARQLDRAITALQRLPESALINCSAYYGSKAIGPGPQGDYANAVAALATTLSPLGLLDALQSIERQQGRTRTLRWGPRTLDLDILLYGSSVLDDAQLTLPHPRIYDRNFVIAPLFEIAPDLILPDGLALSALFASSSPHGLWRLPTEQ